MYLVCICLCESVAWGIWVSLVLSQHDRRVVALDRRVLHPGYGRLYLGQLEPFQTQLQVLTGATRTRGRRRCPAKKRDEGGLDGADGSELSNLGGLDGFRTETRIQPYLPTISSAVFPRPPLFRSECWW